jgi:hypothetical protein
VPLTQSADQQKGSVAERLAEAKNKADLLDRLEEFTDYDPERPQ